MSDISEIVFVNINRETTAVSRAAFNIPMFLANHTAFSERAREYADIDEVGDDFSSTSHVYIAASKLFGQTSKPPRIVVGRRQVNEVNGTVTVANSTTYTITVNGTPITYTSDSSATTAEIIVGLGTAFSSAAPVGVTYTNVSSTSFKVAVSTAGTAWSFEATANITITNTTPTETWPDAITAVEQENDEWYALTAETHVAADIISIAGAMEARDKMYFTSSSDSAIITSGTTDVGSLLQAASYFRTSLIYSATADTEYPECGWVGSQLPQTPGTNSWKFKTISGATRSRLSSTEITYTKNKNVNTYRTIGGVNMTAEGKVSGGEFIDTMILCDYIKARMQENIFSRLVNLLKVPFTNAGLVIIENEIRAVLAESVNNGGLSANPAPTVSMPDVTKLSANVKALRTVEGITFRATLAGAVHFVSIIGTVSV